MTDILHMAVEDGVCRITMQRPEVMNALNRPLRSELLAALRGAFDQPLEAQLAVEARLQGTCGASEDFREGVAAFLEKRAPRFTGQ